MMRRMWTVLALASFLVVPALTIIHESAFAAGVPKAEWRANKGGKAKVVPKAGTKAIKTRGTLTPVEPEFPLPQTPPSQPVAAIVQDQSQEVLDVDFATAAIITEQGPKDGYARALSDEGILYDANGASPAGREAANSRFGSFPADVKLVRTPERALAAGGSGSSWGTYNIKRGETILSTGRYVSVWRRETSGWKMISELAAGKTLAPPPTTPISGILPKRPPNLARAAQSPERTSAVAPTPTETLPAAQPVPTP